MSDVKRRLSTASKEEQRPIQNINSTYSNAVMPKIKKMLFIRDENETSKFAGEGRKKTLKSIPWRQSQSAESLRHSTLDKFDYD